MASIVLPVSSLTQNSPPTLPESEESYLIVDPGRPNWAAVDAQGANIYRDLERGLTLPELVAAHADRRNVDAARAWFELRTFLREVERRGLLPAQTASETVYRGRENLLTPTLREAWVHTNDRCNLSCAHCLVSSSPRASWGQSTERLLGYLGRLRAAGVRRFYFTGGEPLLRKDWAELAASALEGGRELVILTNGLPLLNDGTLRALGGLDKERLTLQISLDGPDAATNDPIRGRGSFDHIVKAIRLAVGAGFQVSVSTVVCKANAEKVPDIPRLLAQLGVAYEHLLWFHERGRGASPEGADAVAPVPPERLVEVFQRVLDVAEEVGVKVDNYEGVRARLGAPRGTKFDLGNMGLESICVHSDGRVYPSAALAGLPELAMGTVDEFLAAPFQDAVSKELLSLSVAWTERCPQCRDLALLTGGGDAEHAYLASRHRTGRGDFAFHDPYCPVHAYLVKRAMRTMALEALRARPAPRTQVPWVLAGMGDRGLMCGDELRGTQGGERVETLHSNCALRFEIEKYRRVVRGFYGAAAEKPKPELCCPMDYDAEDLCHIPKEVLERAYGCGSPVALASPTAGETFLDLGSGAGIDVFIASKKVGPNGRAIGVDMTREMLEQAREAAQAVGLALGYDNVQFRHGVLEQVPADDASVDILTSNCVINLSPDKPAVLREAYRILRPGGRLVVSDIVASGEVPDSVRVNPRLWGECIAGALQEDEFLSDLEEAGFYGTQVLKRSPYRVVDGRAFVSVTVRAYKGTKSPECVYRGHRATYLGPGRGLMDDDGHLFERGVEMEVCTDTLAKLLSGAYPGSFRVVGPDGAEVRAGALPTTGGAPGGRSCDPSTGCC